MIEQLESRRLFTVVACDEYLLVHLQPGENITVNLTEHTSGDFQVEIVEPGATSTDWISQPKIVVQGDPNVDWYAGDLGIGLVVNSSTNMGAEVHMTGTVKGDKLSVSGDASVFFDDGDDYVTNKRDEVTLTGLHNDPGNSYSINLKGLVAIADPNDQTTVDTQADIFKPPTGNAYRGSGEDPNAVVDWGQELPGNKVIQGTSFNAICFSHTSLGDIWDVWTEAI